MQMVNLVDVNFMQDVTCVKLYHIYSKMTDKENSIFDILSIYSVYFLYYINANIIISKYYLPYMYCIYLLTSSFPLFEMFMFCLSGV